jgi:hypothetical protein
MPANPITDVGQPRGVKLVQWLHNAFGVPPITRKAGKMGYFGAVDAGHKNNVRG